MTISPILTGLRTAPPSWRTLQGRREPQRDPTKIRTRNGLVVNVWGLTQYPLLTRDTPSASARARRYHPLWLLSHPTSRPSPPLCPYCHTSHLLLDPLIYRHAFSHDALRATCFPGRSSTTTNSTNSIQHGSTQVTSHSSLQPSQAERVSRIWDLPGLR